MWSPGGHTALREAVWVGVSGLLFLKFRFGRFGGLGGAPGLWSVRLPSSAGFCRRGGIPRRETRHSQLSPLLRLSRPASKFRFAQDADGGGDDDHDDDHDEDHDHLIMIGV